MNKERRIAELPLFSACPPGQLRFIARAGDEIEVPEGGLVTHAGDRVREFVVIIDGAAAADDGRVLTSGAHVGEVALVTGDGRHSDIVALTPVRALVFDARAFSGMLVQAPSVARKLMRELADRVVAA